jgi:RING-like zinc finger
LRITTMCVGPICIGYRSSVEDHATDVDYSAAVPVFLSAFFFIWITLVALMLLGEYMRHPAAFIAPIHEMRAPQAISVPPDAREAIVKEIFARRRHIEEASPITICAEDSAGELCAICLEVVANGSFCRQLPCGHRFHADCIDNWVLQSCGGQFEKVARCPVCKTSAVPSSNVCSPKTSVNSSTSSRPLIEIARSFFAIRNSQRLEIEIDSEPRDISV